jgi:pimeloyl-ACP methyl ester carboxylesterase
MSIFVLVPGAWHGGWCWKKLTPLLRNAGHEVYTPTLTGLGERSHLLSREINLDTHIKDILSLLEFQDLNEVILVGHSYAAQVIAGVAELASQRLSHLVNLDGPTPMDGKSLFDTISDEQYTEETHRIIAEEGEGWKIPFSERTRNLNTPESNGIFGVTDAEEQKWMRERLTAQPAATFEQKVRFARPEALGLPKTCIWCSVYEGKREETPPSTLHTAGWSLREIQTGHDAMISAPIELARILLSLNT